MSKYITELANDIAKSCPDLIENGCGNDNCVACLAFKLIGLGYQKQEWISVDERLPDDCGMPVLMVAVNRYGQSKVVKGFTNYTCPFEFLTNEKEYESVWRSAWKVTHWMPLPEPPMMKGGAE